MPVCLHVFSDQRRMPGRSNLSVVLMLALDHRADIVSGKVVDKLRYHHEIVRDLSWHPSEPMLVTTSFDGTVVQWEPKALHGGNDDEAGASVIRKRRSTLPEDPGEDRLEEFY